MQRQGISAQQLADEMMVFFASTMRTAQGEVFRLVDELELTMTQLKMLFVLAGAEEDLTPSELARHLGLSPAATGRAVDGLARREIVSRREDEADRRVKRLALTAHGREVVERVSAARRAGLLRLTETLDPGQREALSAALAPLLTPLPSPDCAPCAKDSP
jgi:DNA-binding MarR family transcriptional regulator